MSISWFPLQNCPSLCIPAVWVRLRSSSALSTSWEKQFQFEFRGSGDIQGSKHRDSVRFLQGPSEERNISCLTLGKTNSNYLITVLWASAITKFWKTYSALRFCRPCGLWWPSLFWPRNSWFKLAPWRWRHSSLEEVSPAHHFFRLLVSCFTCLKHCRTLSRSFQPKQTVLQHFMAQKVRT